MKYATDNTVYAWREPWPDAACGGQTRLMVMPDSSSGRKPGSRSNAHIARAKEICASCPVRIECLAWALSEPDPAIAMIAGGTTPGERRKMRGGGRSRRQTFTGT